MIRRLFKVASALSIYQTDYTSTVDFSQWA